MKEKKEVDFQRNAHRRLRHTLPAPAASAPPCPRPCPPSSPRTRKTARETPPARGRAAPPPRCPGAPPLPSSRLPGGKAPHRRPGSTPPRRAACRRVKRNHRRASAPARAARGRLVPLRLPRLSTGGTLPLPARRRMMLRRRLRPPARYPRHPRRSRLRASRGRRPRRRRRRRLFRLRPPGAASAPHAPPLRPRGRRRSPAGESPCAPSARCALWRGEERRATQHAFVKRNTRFCAFALAQGGRRGLGESARARQRAAERVGRKHIPSIKYHSTDSERDRSGEVYVYPLRRTTRLPAAAA